MRNKWKIYGITVSIVSAAVIAFLGLRLYQVSTTQPEFDFENMPTGEGGMPDGDRQPPGDMEVDEEQEQAG